MSTTLPEQSSVVMVESVPWYKNKVYVGILSVVVIAGIGLGIYFGTKKKSTDTPSTSITGKAGADAQQAAPVDAQWSSWGECKKDTDGIWKRYRTCTQEGKNGGKTCSQGTKVENCEVVNGGWSVPKDSDAVCQLKTDSSGKAVKDSAGREIWVKKRVCDNPVPQNGGAGCIGDAEVRCEPVNGNWGSTFNDEVCLLELTPDGKAVQDPEGRKIYSKTIECIPPKYGGFDCPAFTDSGVTVNKENDVSKTARKICETTDGRWGEFGTCALKSSGSNDMVKTRVCILPKLGDKVNVDAGKPCTSEYPLFNLTGNDDSGYIISVSSEHPGTWKAFYAFDGKNETSWHSNVEGTNNLYNSSTGVYNGVVSTLVGTKSYLGEWIQIQFPPTTIHSTFRPFGFKITPRTDVEDIFTRRSPRNFALLGSNNGSNWSIVYDNTTEDGIKDWTNASKTFMITTNVGSPGYRYYRLVITRVGNESTGSTRRNDPRNSVQIADFRIIGTPFIPIANSATEVFQVSETIPCNVDCRWNEWKPACAKEGDKWIQKRDSVAPVGSGKACSLVDGGNTTRVCPETATNWSAWGAFRVNNSTTSTGTPSQFEVNQSYLDGGDLKQVRYIQLGNNQGCPSDTSSISGNTCYQFRKLWGDWSECSLPDPNGKWIQTRKNNSTGDLEPRDCTPTPNWQVPPTNQFRVKVNNTDWYLSSDCGIGNACQVEHRGNGLHGRGYMCMKARQDRGQIFQSGAGLGWTGDQQYWIQINKDTASYDTCRNGDGCTLDFVPWCRNWQEPNKGARLVLNGSSNSEKNQWNDTIAFEYAPNTRQFRLKKNFDDNLRCLTSYGKTSDNETVGLAVCNPNDKNQRFEAISR